MVKATLRKTVTNKPLETEPGQIVDAEIVAGPTAERALKGARPVGDAHVDTTSADDLADQLDAGAPVPGSDEAAEKEMAIAPRTSTLPAQPGRYSMESGGALEGEFDSGDLKLPQLKIVNGSGELSQHFNQGSLLYADELLWPPPDLKTGAKNPVLRLIPLKVTKQFRENLTQDEIEEGLMPRIANSAQEARAMGGTTEWINGQKPRWSPSARCILLLEEPEGCEHPGFATELDGKNYALAVYYAGGMAYNESAKQIFNAAQISLKENGKIVLHSRFWTWQVVKKKAGNFMVFVPSLKLTKEVTGEGIRDLAETVLGRRTSDAGE